MLLVFLESVNRFLAILRRLALVTFQSLVVFSSQVRESLYSYILQKALWVLRAVTCRQFFVLLADFVLSWKRFWSSSDFYHQLIRTNYFYEFDSLRGRQMDHLRLKLSWMCLAVYRLTPFYLFCKFSVRSNLSTWVFQDFSSKIFLKVNPLKLFRLWYSVIGVPELLVSLTSKVWVRGFIWN